jgi:23S rRNA (guanosine2251-2'-O)-methyltransferase
VPESFQIRLCENPECGLRYPLQNGQPFGERCPVCLGSTRSVLTREFPSEGQSPPVAAESRLAVLLDNLRSAWNVGAIFRTADGLGLQRLYLCGITPTPEEHTLRKTSLGSERTLAWEYARNALELADRLKAEGHKLVALEQDRRAHALTGSRLPIPASQPLVLILGNEVTGVDPGLLDLCDHIVDSPMRGHKRSLNVEVAFGIAAFTILQHLANSGPQ